MLPKADQETTKAKIQNLPILFALLAIIALLGALAAIAGNPSRLLVKNSLTISPTPTKAQSIFLEPTQNPKEVAMKRDALAQKTIADLAKRLKISETQINMESAVDRQWSDSSLGCPEKGKFYLQVITPGYLITLSVTGKNYEYHTDKLEHIVLCSK